MHGFMLDFGREAWLFRRNVLNCYLVGMRCAIAKWPENDMGGDAKMIELTADAPGVSELELRCFAMKVERQRGVRCW
jgi:hypothetical protein